MVSALDADTPVRLTIIMKVGSLILDRISVVIVVCLLFCFCFNLFYLEYFTSQCFLFPRFKNKKDNLGLLKGFIVLHTSTTLDMNMRVFF